MPALNPTLEGGGSGLRPPAATAAAAPDNDPRPPSAPQEQSQPAPYGATDYLLDKKFITVAVVIEGTVIVAGIITAVAFASDFGHSPVDWAKMLAPQGAFVAAEASRIPLAIKARVHPSLLVRLLAVTGLLGGAAITTKTMIQALDNMYEPRFAAVRHAETTLEEAKENQASFNKAFEAAEDDVKRAKSVVDQEIARVSAASGDLRGLPPAKCPAKQKCAADPRAKLIGINLSAATAAVAAAKHDLDGANARLKLLDPSKPSQAVRMAEAAKRDALSASQFHLLAAQLTGKPVTDITPSEMSTLMRWFILGASVMTASIASLMAICAVTIKKKPKEPELLEIPDSAVLATLGFE